MCDFRYKIIEISFHIFHIVPYTNQNNGSYLGLYTCFMVPHIFPYMYIRYRTGVGGDSSSSHSTNSSQHYPGKRSEMDIQSCRSNSFVFVCLFVTKPWGTLSKPP
eukprot:sb/3477966/